MKLETLGWNNFFEACFATHHEHRLLPGRVSIQHKDRYVLFTGRSEVGAKVSGKFRFDVSGLQDFPAVGDWVAYEIDSGDQSAVIHHVLERRSKFSRKVAGDRPDEQIIAANIDIAFLVMGLDGNYNLRRLERYLTAARESEARSVIVLNKSDLCPFLGRSSRPRAPGSPRVRRCDGDDLDDGPPARTGPPWNSTETADAPGLNPPTHRGTRSVIVCVQKAGREVSRAALT